MMQSSFKLYFLNRFVKNQKFLILSIAILFAIFCWPIISSFAYFQLNKSFSEDVQKIVSFSFKPQIETVKLYVTAYSSTPEETDDTPCITANSYNLCLHDKENVVACNFLPFGTQVRFPELNPDKIYTVVDRMHERFNSRIDIWMTSHQKAEKFGIKYLTVEIIK
jgi:3D (Asp-Asp-Asp) domain-containing protein